MGNQSDGKEMISLLISFSLPTLMTLLRSARSFGRCHFMVDCVNGGSDTDRIGSSHGDELFD